MMLSLLLSLASASTVLEAPTRIDEVKVGELWFSKEATVLRELPFHVGDEVTPELWQLFINRLWNLGIFSRVDVSLAKDGEKNIAVVTLEDRFPIGPVIRANFGGGQFFLWAGVADVNVFGRALELKGFYERFGTQNGFHVHVMDPRLFNERIAALLEVEWLSRNQPDLIVRRAAVRASVDFNAPTFIDDLFRLGVRLEGSSDELFAVPEVAIDLPANSRALIGGPYLRVGRLDTDRLRFSQGFLEAHGDFGTSTDPAYPFFALVTLEGQYFWKFLERFNVGTRVLGGFERGARPQDRPLLGGLSQVRGYFYGEVRAQAYAVANAELRFVAFDSTWFAVMPVAFVDAAIAQRDTGEVQPLASAGLGLRLMVPRLVRFGIRFEVALPFVGTQPTASTPGTPQFHPGINFGVWHYF